MINNRLSLALAVAALLASGPFACANQPSLPGPATTPPAATNQPIAWSDLGTKATAQYSGDGLTVFAAADGAVRLRCAFQKLDGEVTREGLWLNSTVPGAAASRFRVVADRVGRDGAERSAGIFAGVEIGQPTISPTKMSALQSVFGEASALPRAGQVEVMSPVARFVRPGLTEEYSVSVDGVRQDFVVAAPPAGSGDLRVELAVDGAQVETLAGPSEPDAGSGDPAYTTPLGRW